jgi:geranylgeranyl transferase type-2 subunit beta
MDREPYLQRLTAELSASMARLPSDIRTLHATYLRHAQNNDGGFSGREGGSDLYYTAFALRGLAVLDALTPEVIDRAAGFLRAALTGHTSVVDFYSLLYACFLVQAGGGGDVLADAPADWPERVAATLEAYRTADGGYTKMLGNISGSTYHTFLVGLCYQLLGRPLPQPEAMASFIRSRRREDGGFVELAPMKRGGTNPTAAAIGVLQMLSDADATLGPTTDESAGVSAFLVDMTSDEGGLRANGRAPLADLLSTFTGAWTLYQLGSLAQLDLSEANDFVHSLAQPSGGFRGGLWDEGHDVEYTFYGLGASALFTP